MFAEIRPAVCAVVIVDPSLWQAEWDQVATQETAPKEKPESTKLVTLNICCFLQITHPATRQPAQVTQAPGPIEDLT